MGQYYQVIARRNGKDKVYNRDVGEEYTMAKLMEHSWWKNDFCRAFAETLVDKPAKVCWVGDYAEEDECEALGFTYHRVWEGSAVSIKASDFKMEDVKYLINNDKKLFVDLKKYYEKSVDDGWCIFPISILTCLGNDRGGGDYHEECATCWDSVGSWAFDEIYVSNTLPEGYKELDVYFKEN